uniref:Dynein heavy chain C-terminal domain-containing protein n=1 Tax=Ditylenchus dipsaci TaxID=166011 RepID=A0A915D910_9BILA
MLTLSGHCQTWLQILPEKLLRLKRTKENIKDPLFRFFEREINLGGVLLSDVRSDLKDILAVCRGELKQNNHLRSLTTSLNKGQVPTSWIRYTTPKTMTSIEWMNDFSKRMKQFSKLAESKNLRSEEVWLGGVFSPEAYITATRQLIAQANGWSLEQLHLHVSVEEVSQGSDKFIVKGLRLIGAACKSPNLISLTDDVHTDMERVHFSWNKEAKYKRLVSLPVYLYSNRANLLFCLDFVPTSFDGSLLNERGVAIVCNSTFS